MSKVDEIKATFEVARSQTRQVVFWNLIQGTLDTIAIFCVVKGWPFWILFLAVVFRFLTMVFIVRIRFVFGEPPAGKWREVMEAAVLLFLAFGAPFITMTRMGVGFHAMAPMKWMLWPLIFVAAISIGPLVIPVWEWICGWNLKDYSDMINMSEDAQIRKAQQGG